MKASGASQQRRPFSSLALFPKLGNLHEAFVYSLGAAVSSDPLRPRGVPPTQGERCLAVCSFRHQVFRLSAYLFRDTLIGFATRLDLLGPRITASPG